MRLWSLHPMYLDTKGLVALWREGLLAKKVLEGNTRGYKNHPQLNRFKASRNTLDKINLYLHVVCDEAEKRGYQFDRSKLAKRKNRCRLLIVTTGQIEFERQHLLKKQRLRCRTSYLQNKKCESFISHPLFKIEEGEIESWEIV